MTAKRGQRGWGHIRLLPSGRWQASYIGPDRRRHNGPITFTSRATAEDWLAMQRNMIENAWRTA